MPFARFAQYHMAVAATILILVEANRSLAQNVAPDDPPTVEVPKRPPTQKELDRRESLQQYAAGLQFEKEGRLVAALQAFQEAARLDPDAAPVFKAQVPILLAMNRPEECLAAITRVVELEPDDTDAWYIRGRVLKTLSRIAEARAALQKGLATSGVKERPEVAHQMNFELGGILESEKSYKAAAEAFTQAARILEHPEHSLVLGLRPEVIKARIAEVYERLGTIYASDKQFDRAVSSYKKVQEIIPAEAGRISFYLAQIFIDQGKSPEALAAIEAYIATRPQGMEAYEMKIKLLEGLNRPGQVLPWLEQASQGDPFNNSLRMLLADRFIQAKQFDRAEKVYLDMHAKSPNIDLYRGLFRVYKLQAAPGMEKLLVLLNKTFEQATGPAPQMGMLQGRPMVNLLRQDDGLARDLIGHSLQNIGSRKDLKWQTLQFLAILAERHHRLEDAERLYRACLKSFEPNPNMEIQNGLMSVLRKQHKFEEVERICRERVAKAEGQDRIVYLEQLCLSLRGMEKYDEALVAIDEAIKIASDSKNRMILQFARVRTLVQKKDFKQAEDECQAMLKAAMLPSEMMDIHYMLSNVYNAGKQLDKSEEELQWVLRFDPGNVTASNDLGYLWADQNRNLKEAEDMIRHALSSDRQKRNIIPNLTREEDQDNAAYVDSLGWVLFRKGEAEAARKELERATKLPDGENYEIWDHLGDVYQHLRLYKEARNAWQHGIRLYERDNLHPTDERYNNMQRKVKTALPGN